MRMYFVAATVFLTLAISSPAHAEVVPLATLEVGEPFEHHEDTSAIEFLGAGAYVVGVDEGRHLQLLTDCDPGPCRIGETLPLRRDDGDEIDVEAMAHDGQSLFVVGSHACNRRSVKENRDRDDNRKRLRTVTCQESRDGLFRLALDPASGLPSGDVKRQDLRRRLHHDPYLAGFATVPSKENGIDIEGLAVRDGNLFIGFRAPVLRGNWVPVMVTHFEDLSQHTLRWLQLGGRGIRSLATVEGGFLVLGGAVGDTEISFELYFWDGRDCLPDDGATTCRLQGLGALPAEDGAKPEGMTLLQDDGFASGWDILVVYDSAEQGAPRRFRVTP